MHDDFLADRLRTFTFDKVHAHRGFEVTKEQLDVPTLEIQISKIGSGTAVLANAVVNARASIGKGCIINTGAIVEHDCAIADGVHIAPGATLAADVKVGAKSWIGAGAAVKEQVSVGSGVVVGLGAAVIHDVGNGMTVAGVPARSIDPGDVQQDPAGFETTS